MADFDIETATAQIVAEHGISANLARMAAHPDAKVQAKNVAELKSALGAKPQEDQARAAKVEKLKTAYADARERRDVQSMVNIKYRLGQLGVFSW
ncbi:MAG: hypothetical protein KMY53_11585 [Desulfarculus sp.]|nr:hypothetical protein [Pseudomonadota bacterium]MBU4600086.1 hypothetical protein [Pseudomonadota bacterium]MBV1715670.1 hypothetical protein [Desulfarculus sp.]MBV1738798.1 hypothetical protein [Desulfarculus sp.]